MRAFWGMVLGLCLLALTAAAQLRLTAPDTVALGKPFAVQVTWPADFRPLSADTGVGFRPYEVVSWQPQGTTGAAVVLRSWSIDSLQTLRLVLRNGRGDSLVATHLLRFRRRVADLQTAEFQYPTRTLPVALPFRTGRLVAVLVGLFALLVGLAVVLRKPIRRLWLQRQARRRFRQFARNWQSTLHSPEPAPERLARLNRLWMTYLDERQPRGGYPLAAQTLNELALTLPADAQLAPTAEALLEAIRAEYAALYARKPLAEPELAALAQRLWAALETQSHPEPTPAARP